MTTRRELARKAIELVMPAIKGLIDGGFTGERQHLCIVIVYERETRSFLEYPIGDKNDWKRSYDHIAHNKANQALNSGQPNIVAQMMDPASVRNGDTVYYGSYVYGSVAVAASGFQPWFDQLVSVWVAAAYQQLVQDEKEKWKAANPDADFFPSDFLPNS